MTRRNKKIRRSRLNFHPITIGEPHLSGVAHLGLILIMHLFFFGTIASAQEFKVKADFDKVKETGFYKIPITPELTGYAKADFSDIRISDGANFVPYIPYERKPGSGLEKNSLSAIETNVRQKDCINGISYVILHNRLPYIVKEVDLNVEGPKFYNREAAVFVMENDKDSFGLNQPVDKFIISTGTPAIFFPFANRVMKANSINPEFKAATIVIEIDNKDNPPLKITGATMKQEINCLVAWLEKGKTYSLLAGSVNASAPQYDLSAFKDSIPYDIVTLSYGPIQLITNPAPSPIKPNTNYWLWPSILIAVLMLSGLTFRLLKDMKKAKI